MSQLQQPLLRIDNREKDLLKAIDHLIATAPAFKDMTYKVEQLALGDIIISGAVDGTLAPDYVIIERKQISDLFASIKDGRYEEQSCRLNGVAEWANHNIIYLVEGNRTFATPNDRTTFFSSLFSLNYYKGFSVMRTVSLDETAFFILNTVKRIERNNRDHKYPLWGYSSTSVIATTATATEPTTPTPVAYVDAIKKVKKDNVTPENIGAIMLCSIPHLSATTATAIMEKYGTLENLIKVLREKGIADLKGVADARKLNKTVLANIERYLLGAPVVSVASANC